MPEYQASDTVRFTVAAKQAGAELAAVFLAIRDARSVAEFARALRFTDDEVAALVWLSDWIAWRRERTAVRTNRFGGLRDDDDGADNSNANDASGRAAVAAAEASNEAPPARREREA